ncbi:MAG: sulfotransferase [Cyanobacteria bacterium J06632_22]
MAQSAEATKSPEQSVHRLPNFLIIGVQKSGTTSIYNYLKAHPQIFMSSVKETNFFERNWENESPERLARRKNGINTLADYSRLFDGVTDEQAWGEASPNYLFHHQQSVDLIRQHVPGAKLIAILRNPVERAYSDYLMSVRDAIGTSQRSLGEQVKTRGSSSFTLLKGRYYEQIKHFIDVFGTNQVQVLLYDDLRQDAGQLMQDMYAFLGVDPTFTPDTSKRAQTAQVPKNQALNRLMRTENPLRSVVSGVMRGLLPESTRQKLRSQLLSLNSQSKAALPLSDTDRQLLIDYYRDDILKLQDLLGRDLSAWLR